jgi:flavin reductase (DIM6/NTAB) family NADH-FMN oxidoreductase RutF
MGTVATMDATTPEDMRAVMARFATGVAVVTTAGPDGSPRGSTANAISSVSLDPPLVLVCLREQSETLASLQASGGFAINVLAEDQQPLADRFVRASSDAQWEGVSHSTGATGSPLFDGTLAALECAVHEEADGGDHRIVIGRVLSVRLADQAAPPLLFAEARYHGIGDALQPTPPAPEVPLPTRHGDLQVSVRRWTDDGSVAMVAVAGEPRGTTGAALYVHQGCLVGDLLDACCGSRSTLHGAIEELGESGGVVVYHRAKGAAGACAAAGGDAGPGLALAPGAVQTALAAVDELALGAVHLRTNGHDELRTLTDAGLDVASSAPLRAV